MMEFIDRLSREVLSRFGNRLEAVCMVFPSRRASLFFQEYLGRNAGKTILIPEMLTMSGLMERLSGISIIDDLDQLLALFEVVKEGEGSEESHEELPGWGQTLLSDFNDIDMQMVDAESLFTYLDEAKAISLWDPSGKELNEFQKDYLKFYNSLYGYYQALRTKLDQRNAGYAGMVYRAAVERLQNEVETGNLAIHYVFAGFNALSKSEEKVMDLLIRAGRGSAYWDIDSWFLEDQTQEAGNYLREHIGTTKTFGVNWIESNLSETHKKLNIIGSGLNTMQAGKVAAILAGMSQESLAKTAVILNDEQLLFPLLNSLPENVRDFNLSMGLSLRFTPAGDFINDFFRLHERYRQNGDEAQFQLTGARRILQHPWVQVCSHDNYSGRAELPLNRSFITASEIAETMPKTAWDKIEPLFRPWTQATEALRNLTSFIGTLDELNKESATNKLDSGAYPLLESILRTLETTLPEGVFRQKRKLKSLIMRLVQRQSIRFSGEPLRGLQIMGMLETRLLDFDTVIITGMNEGLLPQAGMPNTFVPMDVRHFFGLPMPRDKESVFAYHFYRLISRASDIHLLYSTDTDSLGSGGKSRYLQQLIRELPQRNQSCDISNEMIPLPRPLSSMAKKSIPKDEAILHKLKEIAVTGYSASHLMTYITCGVKFYHQYVIGLNPEDDPDNSMDSSTLGSAVHDVLHRIYSECRSDNPYEGLENGRHLVPQLMREAMEKRLGPESVDFGENYLLRELANTAVVNFLELEIGRQNTVNGFTRILGLEEKFSSVLMAGEMPVKLKGTIDRIDEDGEGNIRIIDYKSGQVKNTDLKAGLSEVVGSDGQYSKAFQLLFYAWLYLKNTQETRNIKAGIFSLRNLASGLIPLQIGVRESGEVDPYPGFESEIQRMIMELLNPEEAFRFTENEKNCTWCDFQSICGKH